MKVYTSYVTVLNAVDTYDDLVLQAAQRLALALCAGENANWDSLLDELNAQFEDDCRAIGVWDEDEEVCTDNERLDRVLARGRMAHALELIEAEQAADAIPELMFAMLTRSIAYEKMYG
jgi:hypothetical protein